MNTETPELAILFELSPIGMSKVSTTNKWLKVNESFCKILGYSKDEILRMTSIEMTHPDDRKKSAEFVRQALDGKINAYQIEKRYRRQDGAYIWCSLSVSLVHDEDGKPKYFIAQILDINDKKNSEVELAEKNQVFESMFKDSALGMGIMTLDSKFFKANDNVFEIIGYKEKELLGKSFMDFVHPDDIPQALEVAKLIKQGKLDTYNVEIRYIHKKGHIVWVSIVASLIRDLEGQPKYWISQVQDVTERKKMEVALKASQERYELVLDATRDGIWDLPDMDKDEEYWSPRWKKLLGYKENEIEASTSMLFSMLHPEDVASTQKAFEDHVKLKKPFDVGYRLKTKSGKYKWFRAKGVASDNSDGSKRMTGSITDIDQYIQAKATLDEKNQVFESMFKDSAMGMAILELDGKCRDVNKKVTSWFGYSKKELTTRNIMDVIYQEDVKGAKERLAYILQSKSGSYTIETRFVHKKGHIFWLLVSVSLIKDRSGGPGYFICQAQNITQRKEMEIQISEKSQVFESVFKYSDIGMVVVDVTGKFVKANSIMCKMVGYNEKELVTLKFKDITHEDDEAVNLKNIKLILEGKKNSYHAEKRYLHKEGHAIWALLSVTPVKDKNGEVLYLIAQIMDVTDRKLAERALKKSQERYELAVQGPNIGIFDYDLEGKSFFWSESLYKMLGLKVSLIHSMDDSEQYTHPEDKEKRLAALEALFKKNKPYDVEMRMKHNKGHYIWTTVKANVVRDKKGNVIRLNGSTEDITHKKLMELQIAERTKKFESVFNNSYLGMTIVSLDNKYIKVNKAFCKITGYPEQGILGLGFADITPKEDLVRDQKGFGLMKDGHKDTYHCEKRYTRKNGEIIWVYLTAAVVRDENGKALYHVAQIDDITSRKKAEVALKKANERYQLIIEASNDGIWEWPDVSKDEQYWSPMLLDSLGYKKNEFNSSLSNFASILHPADTEKVKIQSDPKMLNKPVEVEFRVRCKSGEYKYYLAKSIFKHDPIKDIYFVSGTVSDIHDKKMVDKALLEANERYDMAVSGSRDGIWDWKFSDGVEEVYWSPQMFKIMGYENLEFEPSYLHFMDKLLHSDDKDVVSDVLDSTKSKDISFDFVFRLRIKPGNYEWFQVKGIMHEYTKELWRSSGSLTNINQRKLNEQKIIEYTKELERINDDLDTFAYIASHDLKEPIRGLNNNAIFLKEDHAKDLSDQAMKRIDRIMFLCARMEKLVDDLLHFARLKNQQIYIKKVDLNNVVEDIKDTIDVVLFEQNAQIIMKRPLPKYVCDRIIVTELFRNLITNGVKYNKSKNKIIEVGYSEEILDKKTGLLEYVFYVKDNGIGIKKSYHKDIFKVFKRIHDDDEYIGGTGVGLTFVKKIVERHGGRIWLESTLGEGSTFYFTLSSRKIENQDE